MAALTEDRFGQLKVKKSTLFEHFPLATDEVIFAHSLVALNASGELVAATAASTGPIMYAQKHLEDGYNTMQFDSHGENEQGQALSDVTALLDATGLSAGDEGEVVYADDDHTVSTVGTGGRPAVGHIVKVVSATEAYVNIPGLKQSLAADPTA